MKIISELVKKVIKRVGPEIIMLFMDLNRKYNNSTKKSNV